MSDKLNYSEFDMLRGFAIWIVILAHNIFYQITSFNTQTFELIFTFMRFFGAVMPIFFFVAAYGSVKVSKRNPKYFLISRLKLIGIPYLIWSTFYIIMQYVLRNSQNFGMKFSPLSILGYYLLGSSIQEYYFIFVLVIFYLLTPFFVNINFEHLKMALSISFIFMIVFSSLYYIPNYFGRHLISTFWAYRNPLIWLFFYLLGIYTYYKVGNEEPFWRKPLNRKLLILCLVFYILSFLEFYFMPNKYTDGLTVISPMVLIFSTFFIPVLLRFSYVFLNELPRLAKIFGRFGRHTLGIYLANGLVEGLLLGLGMIFYAPFKVQSSLYANLLLFTTALIISYLMVEMVWKFNKKVYALIF